jgi:hypothetical protein
MSADGLRNLTKEELAERWGKQMMQASPEAIAELQALRLKLMNEGYELPPTPSIAIGGIGSLLGGF